MLVRKQASLKKRKQKEMSSQKKSSAATSPTSSAPDLSIRSDKVAILSTGYTKPASEQGDDKEYDSDGSHEDEDSDDDGSRGESVSGDESAVVSHAARFRQSPWDFFREIGLHVSGTGWRSYDNFIGQPIFYNGFSERMKAAVLSSPLLQEKIRYLADRRVKGEEEQGLLQQGAGKRVGDWNEDGSQVGGIGKEFVGERRVSVESSLQKVAEKLIDNMICKMESKRFIRGAYYLAIQLLTRAYHQGRMQCLF